MLEPKIKGIIYVIITIVVISVLFFVCAILDCVYLSKKEYFLFTQLLDWVKCMADLIGLKYKYASDAFSKNYSIIITAISIVVTLSCNVFNRLEIKRYGIPLETIFSYKCLEIIKGMRMVVFFMPLLMVLAIIREAFITCTMVIIYVYCFVMVILYLLEISYSKDKTKKGVRAKIYSIVPDDFEYFDELEEYFLLLENIRIQAQEEKYWHSTEELYNEIINEDEKSLSKYFGISYNFYNTVFAINSPMHGSFAVRIFNRHIMITDEEMVSGDKKKINRRNSLLWGMLCSGFMSLSEESIVQMIHILLDYPRRSRKILKKYGKNLSEKEMDVQIGLVLINMECLLRSPKRNKISDFNDFETIWEHGKRIFEAEFFDILSEYLELYKKWVNNQDQVMIHSIDTLRNDYTVGVSNSLVRCMITMVK